MRNRDRPAVLPFRLEIVRRTLMPHALLRGCFAWLAGEKGAPLRGRKVLDSSWPIREERKVCEFSLNLMIPAPLCVAVSLFKRVQKRFCSLKLADAVNWRWCIMRFRHKWNAPANEDTKPVLSLNPNVILPSEPGYCCINYLASSSNYCSHLEYLPTWWQIAYILVVFHRPTARIIFFK